MDAMWTTPSLRQAHKAVVCRHHQQVCNAFSANPWHHASSFRCLPARGCSKCGLKRKHAHTQPKHILRVMVASYICLHVVLMQAHSSRQQPSTWT